eukprot:Lithocolla_globosa_v1_NODE_1107_length_2865_cov_21.419573.p2 type:complete len:339 gc:universal NODE_1107_length_2865_cov_21.419573:230-1246(+)
MTAMATCGKWLKTNSERTSHEKECADCKKKVKKHEESPSETKEPSSTELLEAIKNTATKKDVEKLVQKMEDLRDDLTQEKQKTEKLQQQVKNLEERLEKIENQTLRQRLEKLEKTNIAGKLTAFQEKIQKVEESQKEQQRQTADVTKNLKTYANISKQTDPLYPNLLVTGLPPLAGKDYAEETQKALTKTFIDLCQTALKINVKPEVHLQEVRRLKSGTLLVRFQPDQVEEKISIIKEASKYWKDQHIEEGENKIQLNANIIGLESSVIYFQHQLTREIADIFKEARAMKAKGDLGFAWIQKSSGKLLVKQKKEDKHAIHITNFSDLAALQIKLNHEW